MHNLSRSFGLGNGLASELGNREDKMSDVKYIFGGGGLQAAFWVVIMLICLENPDSLCATSRRGQLIVKFFNASQEMAKTCDLQKAATLEAQGLSYADSRHHLEVCSGSEMMLVQGDRSSMSFNMFVGFLWSTRLIV